MSVFLDTQRVFREGLVAFWRNKIISFSSLLIMTLSLLVFSSLIFINAVLNFSLLQLEDRVDVNIYFTPTTSEELITELESKIKDIPEVRDTQYVSREKALEIFETRHSDDPLIRQSLQELGENPLGATLNIRTHSSTQYGTVVSLIESELSNYEDGFVEKINYFDNKSLIDRLNSFSFTVRNVVYAIMMFFGIIAFLLVMSMMRIVIHSLRNEIEVKRLVGAEHRYIRGPFLVIGALYGFFAGIISSVLLYPSTSYIASKTESFFAGMNIFDFYSSNIFSLSLFLVSIGVLLGVVSSYVATRKYLKI